MTGEQRAVWADYNERGYGLEAVGFTYAGATLDLVFVKGNDLAAVVVRSVGPSEAEWLRIRAALRAFLLARRASGVFVHLDRAWTDAGETEVTADVFPLLP